jgi:hypothetical protein
MIFSFLVKQYLYFPQSGLLFVVMHLPVPDLLPFQRINLSALITIELHARGQRWALWQNLICCGFIYIRSILCGSKCILWHRY